MGLHLFKWIYPLHMDTYNCWQMPLRFLYVWILWLFHIEVHPWKICKVYFNILHPPKEKVMFSSLLICLPVCLFVCLSVRNMTDKRVNGFSKNFRIGGTWSKEQFGIFSGCSGSPFEDMIFLLFPLGSRCMWPALRKNASVDFHELFRIFQTLGK